MPHSPLRETKRIYLVCVIRVEEMSNEIIAMNKKNRAAIHAVRRVFPRSLSVKELTGKKSGDHFQKSPAVLLSRKTTTEMSIEKPSNCLVI